MSSRERTLLIVFGVLVLGAAAFFLLTMGGDEPPEQAAPTPTASPPPIPATPGTGVGEPEEPPRITTFFGGRDPFVPLIVTAEDTGGAAPADGETEPAPGETPPEEPITEPPPDAEEGQAGFATTTKGGHTVTLVAVIDSDTAQVTVDGRSFTVDEGETFAQNFEVVSVEANCARLRFGDEAFTLCIGKPPK
jgi:hypothetical protein